MTRRTSAMGQKQTLGHVNAMSACPPIATKKADIARPVAANSRIISLATWSELGSAEAIKLGSAQIEATVTADEIRNYNSCVVISRCLVRKIAKYLKSPLG